MARTHEVFDGPILVNVLLLPVNVVNDETHGGARGEALAHARYDFDLVGLLTRRVDGARAGSAPVEIFLDVLLF